jgi:hypothetical protein
VLLQLGGLDGVGRVDGAGDAVGGVVARGEKRGEGMEGERNEMSKRRRKEGGPGRVL